jgi:hypothetical protein
LGWSKVQFLDVLSRMNLAYLDADLTGLEREIAAAEAAGRKDFEAVLAKVPDAEPDPWDQWTSPEIKISNDC